MLGVFFIKASAYKIVQENSKHGKDSYFYSIEHKSQKSMGHASMVRSGKPHDDFDPGKSKYLVSLLLRSLDNAQGQKIFHFITALSLPLLQVYAMRMI